MSTQDNADHYIAAALRALARNIRAVADANKVHPEPYNLGLRDAALILTMKADDIDPPHDQDDTPDIDPWAGEDYVGPSIIRTVKPIEYRHTDTGNIERVTPPGPSWTPHYGHPAPDPGPSQGLAQWHPGDSPWTGYYPEP